VAAAELLQTKTAYREGLAAAHREQERAQPEQPIKDMLEETETETLAAAVVEPQQLAQWRLLHRWGALAALVFHLRLRAQGLFAAVGAAVAQISHRVDLVAQAAEEMGPRAPALPQAQPMVATTLAAVVAAAGRQLGRANLLMAAQV
jgi:hypothetical protein